MLQRKDGPPSYQLAVTCDDAAMGITQVLRGRDLIQSTARQLALYKALALPAPKQWAHVPLMLAQDKRRLAKRDGDLSLKALRERGVKPERVIALCAHSAGLMPRTENVNARELVAIFATNTITKQDLTLSDTI